MGDSARQAEARPHCITCVYFDVDEGDRDKIPGNMKGECMYRKMSPENISRYGSSCCCYHKRLQGVDKESHENGYAKQEVKRILGEGGAKLKNVTEFGVDGISLQFHGGTVNLPLEGGLSARDVVALLYRCAEKVRGMG